MKTSEAMKIQVIIFIGIFLISFTGVSYEASKDSTAYRIALWKNGDPKSEKIITGKWENLNSGNCEHPECTVQILQKQDGEDTEYRIKVIPKESWGVAEINYPMLFLPRLDNDYVVTAKRIGQRIPMNWFSKRRPNDTLPPYADRQEYENYPDVCNKLQFLFLRYPVENTLQLMMYENDKEGVMIWTPDSKMYVKDFVMSRNDLDPDKIGKGIRAYIVQFPENTGQKGTCYESPYPVLVSSYKNGWRNAAKKYRDWGLKQWWCKAGKICERQAPEWYDNMCVYWGCAGRPGYIASQSETVLKYLEGRICGAQLMNWGKYFDAGMTSAPEYMPAYDPAQFSKNINLKRNSLYLGPYFMFSGVVKEYPPTYEKLKKSVIMTPVGSISKMYWSPLDLKGLLKKRNQIPLPIMQLLEKIVAWQDALKKVWNAPCDMELVNEIKNLPMPEKLRESQKKLLTGSWGKDPKIIENLRFYLTTERLCLGSKECMDYSVNQVNKCIQAYNCEMVYFDTFPHAILPCYDKSHGHTVGFGTYLIEDSRKLCLELTKRYPKLVIACESGSGESLLDVNMVTYFKGIMPEYAIPLFPHVYNGYGKWTNWWMWPPYFSEESYTSNMAIATHLGYLPGGAVQGGLLSQFFRNLKISEDDIKVKYFRDCADVFKKYKKWIADGDRLGDPLIKDTEPKEIRWSVSSQGTYNSVVYVKPVLASLWAKHKEPEKGLLLLSNWTGTEQKCQILGRDYTLSPYEWRGVEMPVTPEILGCPNEPAPVQRVGDSFKIEKEGNLKSYRGKIVQIDTLKKIIQLEYLTLEKGKNIAKLVFLKYSDATRIENIDNFSNLKMGDRIDVQADSKENIKLLIFDTKGEKEDEG